VAVRRHGSGEDQQLLKISTRAEESARELGRDGKGCGEGRGWCSPFYRSRGTPGRRLLGSNGWRLMAHTIDGQRRVNEGGLRGGIKAGE
jgi:hypothetical protein